jgi:uncharacterized protein YciI
MLYAVMARFIPDCLDKRAAARPAHIERLRALQEAGRLILAGPMPAVDAADPGAAGFFGSLIVAEFPSLAEAEAWAKADPYDSAGIYAELRVQPFVKALPA